MAKAVSKNSRNASKTQVLTSRWGGTITTHTVFENGKMRHYARCEKTGNEAAKPKDLM